MISRKEPMWWMNVVLSNLDAIAKAHSTEHEAVTIEHILNITDGREYIRFRVQWKGGSHGCVRWEQDMDDMAENIAKALPTECGFRTPDKVEKAEAVPHAFDAIVYITK